MERERVELIYFHIFYTALANEKLQTKNYNAMSKTPVFIWLRATFSFPSPPFQDIFPTSLSWPPPAPAVKAKSAV
jgi:hypothetical protein